MDFTCMACVSMCNGCGCFAIEFELNIRCDDQHLFHMPGISHSILLCL
ncbi:hypothetical protein V3C99_001837 [Haemonchus contortus]